MNSSSTSVKATEYEAHIEPLSFASCSEMLWAFSSVTTDLWVSSSITDHDTPLPVLRFPILSLFVVHNRYTLFTFLFFPSYWFSRENVRFPNVEFEKETNFLDFRTRINFLARAREKICGVVSYCMTCVSLSSRMLCNSEKTLSTFFLSCSVTYHHHLANCQKMKW